MRIEYRFTLVVCAIGIALPPFLMLVANRFSPYSLPFLFLWAIPYLGIAVSGWPVRRDRRRSRIVALVSLLMLMVVLIGGFLASFDEEGLLGGCLFLVVVPCVQFFIWIAGGVLAGRRGSQSPATRND